jgi:hypothetical protein
LANFEENSPKDRCWLFSRISPNVAMSQNAEHDLVVVGQREEVADALAHPAHEVLDRGLAVGGAEQGGAGGGEGLDRLGADLGRTCSEAAVGGLDRVGDADRVGHGETSFGSSGGDLTSLSVWWARGALPGSHIVSPRGDRTSRRGRT